MQKSHFPSKIRIPDLQGTTEFIANLQLDSRCYGTVVAAPAAQRAATPLNPIPRVDFRKFPKPGTDATRAYPAKTRVLTARV